jgi:hypothetical protein
MQSPRSYKAALTGSSLRHFQEWPERVKAWQGVRKSRFERRTDSDGFRVPRQHWKKQQRSCVSLFVFNVPKSCALSNIRQYVVDQDVKVLDVFQRSHPEARRKSFVVQVSSEDSRRILKPSFWPVGVRVREYDLKGHGQ